MKVTTKTMLLEALSSNDRTAARLEEVRQAIQADRANTPEFCKAMRDTLQACLNSVDTFETRLIQRLDALEARVVDAIAMTQDGGAIAQDSSDGD